MTEDYKTDDYKSDTCSVAYMSDLSSDDAEEMIGKTVAHIDAQEYELTITFSDGTKISCNGWRWDGCSLGVEYRNGDFP